MLPIGVSLVPLTPHPDDRGVFTELFRASWETGVAPVQWNSVRSDSNVLRGVHVHRRHADYLTLDPTPRPKGSARPSSSMRRLPARS